MGGRGARHPGGVPGRSGGRRRRRGPAVRQGVPLRQAGGDVPLRLEDNPSYLNFPGDGDTVEYREGIYVGYRYYDKRGVNVRFPFGHGLTYTTFEYANLRLDKVQMKDTETLTVSVDVTNTGRVAAKEIVQFLRLPGARGDFAARPRSCAALKRSIWSRARRRP